MAYNFASGVTNCNLLTSATTLSIGSSSSGTTTLNATTEASSTTVAGTVVSGGLAIAKKTYFGDSLTLKPLTRVDWTAVPITGQGTWTFNITADAGGIISGTFTVNYYKFGKFVMFYWADQSWTSANTTYATYFTSPIPAEIRPAVQTSALIGTFDNSTYVTFEMIFFTSGNITLISRPQTNVTSGNTWYLHSGSMCYLTSSGTS